MSLHQARTSLLTPSPAIHTKHFKSCQLSINKKVQPLPIAPHRVELHHAFSNNFGVLSMAQLKSNKTPPFRRLSQSRITNSQIRNIKDRSLQHRISGLTQDKVLEELEARKERVESRAWQKYLNQSLKHSPLLKQNQVYSPTRQSQSAVQPVQTAVKEKSSIKYINNFVKTRYRRVRIPHQVQVEKSDETTKWMEPWQKEAEPMVWPTEAMLK